jgi:hypothetical protein
LTPPSLAKTAQSMTLFSFVAGSNFEFWFGFR